MSDFDFQLGEVPNNNYVKFFEKFKEINTLPVKQWNVTHVLAYFCKKYRETYNIDFKFKFNTPQPSKCFEIFQIKKLSLNLTSDPALLKDYIDWAFATKVPQAKRKLTSVSFMVQEDMMQWYKLNVLLGDQQTETISRTTQLLEKYQIIFQEAGIPITTYGELSMMAQVDLQTPEFILALSKIEELGFNKNILEKIV